MKGMERTALLRRCMDDYYDDILNFLFLHIGNHQDAEDLTQETFLIVVRKIDSFQENASIRTWVFAIARNLLFTEYRRKYKVKDLLRKITRQTMPFSDTNQELFLILDAVPQEARDLLILKHYHGFTYQEIAEITGLSVSNVGVRLTRVSKKIQEELRRSESK